MYSYSGNFAASVVSTNFHIHMSVSDLYVYSEDRSAYFPVAEQADRAWKYINLSHIYECRNWETEHYNLEITVYIYIYTGFSQALHQQCIGNLVFNSDGIGSPQLLFRAIDRHMAGSLKVFIEGSGVLNRYEYSFYIDGPPPGPLLYCILKSSIHLQ